MLNRRHIFAIAGILSGLVVLFLVLRASKSNPDLQVYKALLRTQGEKLTLAELGAYHEPSDRKSYTAVSVAVGALANSWLRPGDLEIRKAVFPAHANVCWKSPAPLNYRGARISDWNLFSGEIAMAEPQLALIREAVRIPDHAAGTAPPLLGPYPSYLAIRSAAQWLAAAAISELHQGHLEEALQNIEALAHLAETHRDEYNLVWQMTRGAIASMGLSTTWQALQAPGWTEPQLARLQNAWEPIDLLNAVETGFEGERAGGVEFRALMRGPKARQIPGNLFAPIGNSTKEKLESMFQRHVLLPAYKMTSIDREELIYLQCMQSILTTIRSLKAHQPWVEAKLPMDQALGELQRLGNSAASFRYWLSSRAVPDYPRAVETALRYETERRMTLAAIALERFRLAHGRLPLQLTELSGLLVAVAPDDMVSGKPLHYLPDPDAPFVLYSVGLDGVDDGGNPQKVSTNNWLGMWEGRDAVWPLPAKTPER